MLSERTQTYTYKYIIPFISFHRTEKANLVLKHVKQWLPLWTWRKGPYLKEAQDKITKNTLQVIYAWVYTAVKTELNT